MLLLSGCSSVPTAGSSPMPMPTTYYGENAVTIASSIEGCSGVAAGDVGGGGPGLVSTATCTLDGRLIYVNSWMDQPHGDLTMLLKSDGAEMYYAKGEGWTVTAGSVPILQLQLTSNQDELLKLSLDATPGPDPDLPGQKASAESVTRSLGGDVVHFVVGR
ncbi:MULTISPECIES: hypothetical protein [unclassified Cryobacterium]|uniref:hypothetical protein n=2 Tax=Cryobacterium TaxID=69578 RepID=UPI001A7EA281|nr:MULTISPECIES: hypothetical protein [unclassified Cryobacterium]